MAVLDNVLPVVFYAIGARHTFGSKDKKAILAARRKVDPRFMGLALLKLTHPNGIPPPVLTECCWQLQCPNLGMPVYGVATQPQLRNGLVKLLVDREERIDRSSLMDGGVISLVAGPGFSSSITQPCSGVLLITQINHAFSNQPTWSPVTILLRSPSFRPSMTPASTSLQIFMGDERVDLKLWPPISSDPVEELRLGFSRQNGSLVDHLATSKKGQIRLSCANAKPRRQIGLECRDTTLAKLAINGGMPTFALNRRTELELLLYPAKHQTPLAPGLVIILRE
ncbi:unnamed protein product [Clonostachys rosea f. rosea IK726]|uniref:Uncharacterized protein n=1 Tax=Clonostachys rosea f. rosea IK726 TaxID=1349383 RepID=A0ACA9UMH4_BIOOC|nr:unnamed protein product [Clonostachys rosea f. rosea IK726]